MVELLNNVLDALSKLVDIFRVAESLARPRLHTRVSGYNADNNRNLYIL